MDYLRKIYYRLNRLFYLLRKVLSGANTNIIIYTKNHPIFSTVFEECRIQGFTFVFVNLNGRLNFIERSVFKRSRIIHTDAGRGNFPELAVNKPLVIECEGCPDKSYFAEDKYVFLESKHARKNLAGHNDLEIVYPSVHIPRQNTYKRTCPLTITAVGHGGLIKGFDVVLNIYKTLRKKYDIKLIIAGTTGPDLNFYPEIVKETYDRIDLPGIIKSIENDPNVVIKPVKRKVLFNNIYPATDIYIHMSRMETFGYSILEAMSYGIPVVATNLNAIPEMVVHNETGFLVNDFADDINSEAWYVKSYNEGLNALENLITNADLRRQMGEKAYLRTRQMFNNNIKLDKLERIYNSIIFKQGHE